MATELTVKERAFAQLIIEGTKTAAYRKVYSAEGKAATQAVNAYKLSKKPKIKAEVARLLRQRECPGDDYARIRDLAVAGLTEIFLQEPDPRLRMKAGSILLAYADAGLKLHPEPSAKERAYDEITEYIAAGKYEEAIGREQELIVEPAEEETEPLVVVAAEEAPPPNRGAELLREIRQAPPMEAEVPKPPAPQVRYIERLVSKPGHFPPQFVKVPVR
jgi:hypothetical protein